MIRETVKLICIGVAMGAAEVIPGVSGGTVAFITRIYERLVDALKGFTPGLIGVFRERGVAGVWQTIDGYFLLALFGSMLVTVFLFASGVRHLLSTEPIMVWSFFFGLVIASSFVVAGEISRFGIDLMLAAVTGLVMGLIITSLVPVQLPASPWALFVGGAIAVCAWILPGISGSFILLILGLYAFVLDSISRLDIASLGALAVGCALGLVSFARLLSSLFRHYRDETLAVLTGFMLGSLVKLWPWKQTLSYQLRDDGSKIPLVQEPVMPAAYFEITGSEPQIAVAIGTAIFGLVIVFVIDRLATRRDAHEDPPTGNA